MTEKTATLEKPPQKPNDPDKALMAAYWLGLGVPVKRAAEVAGVGERTLHRWIRCPWWSDFEQEAHRRWLSKMAAEVKSGLWDVVRMKDPQTLRWAGEKLIPELRPRSHIDIDQNVTIDHIKDAADEYRNRIRALAERN